MQHATERVERPDESQDALDGKKGSTFTNYKFNLAETSTKVLYSFVFESLWASLCANTFGVVSARPRRALKRFDCRL